MLTQQVPAIPWNEINNKIESGKGNHTANLNRVQCDGLSANLSEDASEWKSKHDPESDPMFKWSIEPKDVAMQSTMNNKRAILNDYIQWNSKLCMRNPELMAVK